MLDGCVAWPDELAHRYRRSGCWRGVTLGAALRDWAGRKRADSIALVSGDRRWSYRELDAEVDRLAIGFRRLGLVGGDRVVVHLPNVPEFLFTTFALFRIGALPIFALPAHREHEIGYFCDHADAVAYVGDGASRGFDPGRLASRVGSADQRLAHIVVLGGERPLADGQVDLASLRATDVSEQEAREEVDRAAPDPTDVALFLLSGGTTGLPKLIPRTHDDYLYNVERSSEVAGFDTDTVYLVALPIAHNFPYGCPGALGTWSAGGRVVLTTDPSPDAAFPLVARENVTVTALVPALVLRWVEAAERTEHDLRSLDVVEVGGAKLVPELARRIRPGLGCDVQQVFGMAEGLLNFTRRDDPDEVKLTTQGRPISPEDQIAVVDALGNPVDEGAAGELITQGPYTLRGYYRAPEHNERAFTPDGWYRTGDVVRLDRAGNLIVEGRAKDLINRGGEKISAEEVEDLLLGHPNVRNVAAVAMPDPDLGERTCVYVIPRDGDGPTLDDLLTYLDGRGVAKYKWPERLEIVPELPTTNVGKIDKSALRDDVLQRLNMTPATEP